MEPSLDGALALARAATGPLAPHLPAFVSSLIDQRFAVVCVRAKAWRVADFDRWLSRKAITLADVSDAHVDRYHARRGRPRADCRSTPRRNQLSGLRQLMAFLRKEGVLEAATPDSALPLDDALRGFERFLVRDRGLAASTVRGYVSTIRGFLEHRFGDGGIDLGGMKATDVLGFVRQQARRLQPRALKQVVTALRVFLRYAQYLGAINAELINAVPAVAVWTTTPRLPKAILPEHARRAIASCDRRTSVGRRDRAVMLLLSRLGLRSGEVVKLLLDDVDWDAGQLRIRGKNRDEVLLPLPADVGEAIALYLEHGRPESADRHLFLRSRAPFRGLKHDSDGVGSIVRNALERSKVDTPHKGAHQFRHALAVRMLHDGASLPEIGELLRHRSPLATSIYAKVDLRALRGLALPWPGEVS